MSGSGLAGNRWQSAAGELDAGGLEAIRRAVAEKLRHEYRQAPGFATDMADEMVDQAYIEYAEKSEVERQRIRSLPGLLVTTAVRRAIDRARRERWHVHGEGAQAIVENAEDQAPSIEARAVLDIEGAKLLEAVGGLHHEQRRALMLLYWEGLTVRQGAARMGVSSMTICRRRDAALDSLRERLGALV